MIISKTRIFFTIGFLVWCYFIFNAFVIYNYSFEYSEVKSDVVIVLGVRTEKGELSPVFRERINQGIYLYNKGLAKKIIFTGGFVNGQIYSESGVAKKYALTQGIPKAAIIIEEKSRSTIENFRESKQIMDSLGVKTALVVSDPFHMKRSMSFANYYNIDSKPSPTKTTMFKSVVPKAMSLAYETVFFTFAEISGIN